MATLLEVVKEFVRITGENSLVVDTVTYADNGAYDLIYAGQRYLDRYLDHPKSKRIFIKALSAGTSTVKIQDLRVAEEAWVISGSDKNWRRLDEVAPDELRNYYSQPLSELERGGPLFFSPIVSGLAPELYTSSSVSLDADGVLDYADVIFGDDYVYDNIIIYPPLEEAYTFRLLGKFYTRRLTEPGQVNWWTINHWRALVYSAAAQVEVGRKNSEGLKDWDAGITRELQGEIADQVERRATKRTTMRG